MAKKPPTTRELVIEVDGMAPEIRVAFLGDISDIVAGARVNAMEQAVAVQDSGAAMRALGMTDASFTATLESIRSSYLEAGTKEAQRLPKTLPARGTILKARFDVRNVRAEAWLRNNSANLVTNIVEQQREGIRQVLMQGLTLGRNPRTTALDIVGRVGANGRRSGGIVGLSAPQTVYVNNARAELLSGNPTVMQGYLSRLRRDKRFDKIVERAIKAGKPVAAADVDRIVAQYADRLLLLRGESIARTESLAAFNAARDETYQQAIDEGVQPENVIKTWKNAGDNRVRESHEHLQNQHRSIREAFTSGAGNRLMFPGDTSLGAGAEDIVMCRCVTQYKIDYLAQSQGVGVAA